MSVALHKNSAFYYAGVILVLALYLITLHYSFFWDTIQLSSMQANHFYENGFKSFLLPDLIDSGHIPAFGYYLALWWKALGRHLWVSHLAMLPFILGILYQLKNLAGQYVRGRQLPVLFFLVLIDPTLLAQMTLVSPDVALVFFFLLGFNALLNKRKAMLAIAIAALFLVSMRGMMVGFVLALSQILFYRDTKKTWLLSLIQSGLKTWYVYMPAVLVFIFYNAYHLKAKGWMAFHGNSPWAESFEVVGMSAFLKNLIVVDWRFLDFGRFIVWLVMAYIFFKHRKSMRDYLGQRANRKLIVLFWILVAVLVMSMVWAKGLLAHRYFLPAYLLAALFAGRMLLEFSVKQMERRVLICLWIVILLSGHLWIYPKNISQGWDSSLAYMPYDHLRKQSIQYLDDAHIDLNSVGSFFPNLRRLSDTDLSDDDRRLAVFDGSNDYVLYSSVFNLSDQQLEILAMEYEIIERFGEGRVYFLLYKINSDEAG